MATDPEAYPHGTPIRPDDAPVRPAPDSDPSRRRSPMEDPGSDGGTAGTGGTTGPQDHDVTS